MKIAAIGVLAVTACLAACQTEDEQVMYEARNRASLEKPEFVGCLPDKRAVFIIRHHPRFRDGSISNFEDRIYFTTDGDTTINSTEPVSKSQRTAAVFYPGTEDPAKPAVICP